MILIGCSKNDDGESDKPNNNGNEQPENPNEPKLPELPALPDPDDVCSVMDDLNFMAYCYENFDVNKDGKVSVIEANAAKEIYTTSSKWVSVKGIERFPNIEILSLNGSSITELDLRYNLKLKSLSCQDHQLTTVLLPNTLTSIGGSAFSGCSSLTKVTCHALVPPKLNGFSDGTIENLYVPAESIQAYKDSPWANNFKNILPIE